MSGHVAVIVGGDEGVGAEVAAGLEDHGAAVVATPTFSTRADAEGALADAAARRGPIDLVVYVPADDALEMATLAETDEPAWRAGGEAPLQAALVCAQAAFAHLRERGGRLVLVTPAVSLVGGAGLVPFTTALEGMRAMAKCAARQWGRHAVTVNCVAPSIDAWLSEGAGSAVSALLEPALGQVPQARGAVAAIVAFLASTAGAAITGTTVVVDGGAVMVP